MRTCSEREGEKRAYRVRGLTNNGSVGTPRVHFMSRRYSIFNLNVRENEKKPKGLLRRYWKKKVTSIVNSRRRGY